MQTLKLNTAKAFDIAKRHFIFEDFTSRVVLFISIAKGIGLALGMQDCGRGQDIWHLYKISLNL